jgi:phosphatidylserine decarboxylase
MEILERMVRKGKVNSMLKVLLVVLFSLTALVIFGVYFLRSVWFFRDPKREPPKRPGVIVSPADGKVIYIKKVKNGEVVSEKLGKEIEVSEITKHKMSKGQNGWLVGIYMSPLDVHYNYSPISGRVEEIVHTQAPVNLPMVDLWEYVKLVYLRQGVDLFAKRFHFVNERNTIFLKNEHLSMVVVEIADKFVNKIDCYIKKGDELSIGDKLSFIKRGSQADVVVFKEDIDIKVRFGDQVYGGKTVLAEYSE